MRPYGARTKSRCDCCIADDTSRTRERRLAAREAQEQLDGELHPAELQLIDCAAGNCRWCLPRD